MPPPFLLFFVGLHLTVLLWRKFASYESTKYIYTHTHTLIHSLTHSYSFVPPFYTKTFINNLIFCYLDFSQRSLWFRPWSKKQCGSFVLNVHNILSCWFDEKTIHCERMQTEKRSLGDNARKHSALFFAYAVKVRMFLDEFDRAEGSLTILSSFLSHSLFHSHSLSLSLFHY